MDLDAAGRAVEAARDWAHTRDLVTGHVRAPTDAATDSYPTTAEVRHAAARNHAHASAGRARLEARLSVQQPSGGRVGAQPPPANKGRFCKDGGGEAASSMHAGSVHAAGLGARGVFAAGAVDEAPKPNLASSATPGGGSRGGDGSGNNGDGGSCGGGGASGVGIQPPKLSRALSLSDVAQLERQVSVARGEYEGLLQELQQRVGRSLKRAEAQRHTELMRRWQRYTSESDRLRDVRRALPWYFP